MLGMGGAARPHYIARTAAVQPASMWLIVVWNSAGGDPEARPMAGPEGFAPIPRWAPSGPLRKESTLEEDPARCWVGPRPSEPAAAA